ncbi:hypothetical protein EAS61_18005 [Bradyrhizobium zhanjiangense]|uniref:Uncharacterized protein n=1 Tax=Bradyrhizobium zhanjiangense TaxID=1325107 RepID=A0A4Q0QMQ5_9BRAD|nr:hypothetical protein EAS62_31660 [Bradyrhizobium zhanjiangense]RXG95753.1 hypothetical protein EAS61_18005 [Bradyrhizobium zhanjiangense]
MSTIALWRFKQALRPFMFHGDLLEYKNLSALGRHLLFNELVVIMAWALWWRLISTSMMTRKTSAGTS